MSKIKNILFSGVGGQGILLASELTAAALLSTGYDVKKSEVHGMAQRGGSVTAELRYGEKVYSPLIEPGCADIQMAFEEMEAVRYLPYLHQESTVIVNTQHILPPSVATGKAVYPQNVRAELTKRNIRVIAVDAFTIAREAGEVKTANVALVGALSVHLPIGVELFEEIIAARVPERFKSENMKAFAAGREAGAR
ncbi:MAG: indolepyruvate oxidoreductase subunit beta [Proteobacteria bacterium]|nr:MAG: indolepyruvate oxidoreductase subunit beta [Pseudomonadota bacterium]